MTETAASGPTFEQTIAALESMTPEQLAAVMPTPPDTVRLVAEFPELAAVTVEDVTIDGPNGDIAARLYRAGTSAAEEALVWVHGGGFVAGDLDMPEAHWVGFALAARGVPVLSVEYRKCLRRTHFPVPSDDVLAAWRWACDHAHRLGTSADRLHLGGGSAGGNLTAGVGKRLRDGAGRMPASLVLVYPLVHPELPPFSDEVREAMERLAPETRFPRRVVRQIGLQFVGDESMLTDPYAFAANGDVAGQPPVLILNSEADSLRASGEAYGDQLREAGVEVSVELEPGTEHGHLNEPFHPEAHRSIDRILTWLGRH